MMAQHIHGGRALAAAVGTGLVLLTSSGCSSAWDCLKDLILKGQCVIGPPGDPYNGPTDPPVIPVVDDCLCTITFNTTVGGRSDDPGRVVWAALVSNGVVKRSSTGVAVAGGGFGDVHLAVDVPNGSLPAGTYDFMVVMSTGMGSVGSLTSYAALSNPVHVQITPLSCTPSAGCMSVLYGDTLKLKANMVGSNLVIAGRNPGEYSDAGVTWTPLNPPIPTDTVFFANLGNGDFYPLKPNDGILLKWRVRASLSGKTTEVGVMVDAAVTLGTDSTAYDPLIIAAATNHGIPPTIGKAQIYIEDASFDPAAYRYEPHFDSSMVTFNKNYPGGTLLTSSPYSRFRLAVPAAMPKGSLDEGNDLTEDDKSFRNIYTLVDDNGDGYYSAMEIISHNGSWVPLLGGPDFVAQTTLAASYGLKQVMYTTAVNPMNWNNGAGGPPLGLIDATVNLDISSAYLRTRFEENDSIPDWTLRWKRALRDYNGKWAYANAVMDTSVLGRCRPVSN
jgi:hypothetical protein